MFKINLSFRHQFLIFFVLSSILPLLIFSGIFLHKSTTILMSRNAELLQTGIILWEEVVADTLDKLELSANHLALRSDDMGHAAQNLQWPQALRHGHSKGHSEPLMILYNQEGRPCSPLFRPT